MVSPFRTSFLLSLMRGLVCSAMAHSEIRCGSFSPGKRGLFQPPQPPIVTLIGREAEKNVPLLSLATAMTSWVAASRMRVDASGTLLDEDRNRITRAFGFSG